MYPAFKRSEEYKTLLNELNLLDAHKIDEASAFALPQDVSAGASGRQRGTRYEIRISMLGVGQVQRDTQIFAVYNVQARKMNDKNEVLASWNVIRRYSDFYVFNSTIVRQVSRLVYVICFQLANRLFKFPTLRATFPAKKTFNRLNHEFLERRCRALNEYMNVRFSYSCFKFAHMQFALVF